MDKDLKDFLKVATMVVVFIGLIINEHSQELIAILEAYRP